MRTNQPSRPMPMDIPGTVERPPARHNMTIEETEAVRLLNDPIEFAQNIMRVLWSGELGPLLMQDEPNEVRDARDRFESLIDLAIERGDKAVLRDVIGHYQDFLNGALGEAREYGVAMGAVLEQLRSGLQEINDLRERGLTFGDVRTREDLSKLRRKYNFLPSDRALDEFSGIGPRVETPADGDGQAAD